MAQVLQEQDEEIVPILELDEEAAADTAAPTTLEAEPTQQAAVTPQEMWDLLYLQALDYKFGIAYRLGKGLDCAVLQRRLTVTAKTADYVAFLIDNEADVRAYIREQAAKVIPMRRSRR